MKNKMLILILGLALLIACTTREATGQPDDNPTEDITLIPITFEYLQESTYDSGPMLQEYSIPVGSQFTYFYSLPNQEQLDSMSRAESFTYEGMFDFEKYCLFVSFGRKIAELEGMTVEVYGPNRYIFVVTFEEEHFGETAIFYQIENKHYIPSALEMQCYVMNGAERVYLGGNVYQINNIEQHGPS